MIDPAAAAALASPDPTGDDSPTEPLDFTPLTHEALARAQAGEPLTAAELAAIFRVGSSAFAVQRKAGAYDQFQLKPPIGRKVYSGIKVWRYLCGDPVYEPSFGRRARVGAGK